MESTPPRDPEFQASPPPHGLGLYEPDAEHFQRLVANPFLSLFMLLVGFMVGRVIVNLSLPDYAFPLILLLAGGWFYLLYRLLQFHCLDCGATGSLARWRQHACERVRDRRLGGRPRRFRGPTPPVQIVLWLWIALPVTTLALALLSQIR